MSEAPKTIEPNSLLWRYGGDNRIAFTGLSTGMQQLMQPGIGAAVAEHSDFFNEPWERIFRSVPEIMGVIYDPDPEATGQRVRDYHKPVKGKDEQGRRYHALNPEIYWWAHAMFHENVEQIIDRFSTHDLTGDDREQLYAQTTEWYRRYGVSPRPVPATYAGFKDKQEHIFNEVLEMTPAATRAVEMALKGEFGRLPLIPAAIWKVGKLPVNETVRLTAIGGLSATVRERFDIPWTKKDQIALDALQKGIKTGWRFVPPALRYQERARAGHRHQRALSQAA